MTRDRGWGKERESRGKEAKMEQIILKGEEKDRKRRNRGKRVDEGRKQGTAKWAPLGL